MLMSAFDAALCAPEAGEVERTESGVVGATVVAVSPFPFWVPEGDVGHEDDFPRP